MAALSLVCAVAWPASASAASLGPASVQLEDLTWTELRDRVAAGTSIALIPIGGVEQSGPHMALGKHNLRARLLAQRIAEQLGDALVAPVVAYVPEGAIDPPTQHMRYPGTITVPDAAFEATLESAARSLQRAGIRHVFLLGDHGGYRRSLERVAARVNGVHALTAYYQASSAEFAAALKAQGYAAAQIGEHAGLADTSLMLALDPAAVREDVARTHVPAAGDGVSGDARQASAKLGEPAVRAIVARSVAAIRAVAPHTNANANANVNAGAERSK